MACLVVKWLERSIPPILALFHTNFFLKKLEKYKSLERLLAMNLDGCSGNTGIHTGFLRRLECALGMY